MGSGQPITQFQRAYTIITYTDAQLAALGIGEANLNVSYWSGGAWVDLLRGMRH